MQSRLFPLWLGAFIAAAACVMGAMLGADQVEQWQLAARFTARVGFPVFITAYLASSLLALWPNDATRALVRYRRQWGLAFFLTHSVHLVALTGFNMLRDETPTLQTLLGGGGAYAIMYVMALTSNNASVKALGIWWKRLHKLGIHWLWFIFAFSYAGRLAKLDDAGIAPWFLAIALAALGLRVTVWMRKRQQRQANAYPRLRACLYVPRMRSEREWNCSSSSARATAGSSGRPSMSAKNVVAEKLAPR